ncbi:G-protein coupled receptor 15 [Eucyclogobius newberryi]|uniref:G-protein coupled receptor 15 n=1 Tax=Eucyclogobius newberryi TaxID=166745 RepID=UPI003B5BC4A2
MEYEYYFYNYSENSTEYVEMNKSSDPVGLVLVPLLYYLIFFSGFFGNLSVVCVLGSGCRRGGRLVDTFIVNLALADLIFVLTLPLWAISAGRGDAWEFGEGGDLLCRLSSYVICVNRYSNVFFLTCMSVDRYVAVVKLMDSRHLRSSRCIYLTCLVVWLTSLLLGVPSLMYRELVNHGEIPVCVDKDDSKFFSVLTLFMTLFMFIFPVLIIVFSYGTIAVHLNRHCAAAANPRAEARRRHSLKMLLVIIVVFILSWLPYNVFKTLTTVNRLTDVYVGGERSLEIGLLVSSCLAFFNSCVNPVIYFCLDHHFRQRAVLLLKRCTGKAMSLHSYNSTTFTNFGNSESGTNAGKTQV